jgi:hypothetical protein
MAEEQEEMILSGLEKAPEDACLLRRLVRIKGIIERAKKDLSFIEGQFY